MTNQYKHQPRDIKPLAVAVESTDSTEQIKTLQTQLDTLSRTVRQLTRDIRNIETAINNLGRKS